MRLDVFFSKQEIEQLKRVAAGESAASVTGKETHGLRDLRRSVFNKTVTAFEAGLYNPSVLSPQIILAAIAKIMTFGIQGASKTSEHIEAFRSSLADDFWQWLYEDGNAVFPDDYLSEKGRQVLKAISKNWMETLREKEAK